MMIKKLKKIRRQIIAFKYRKYGEFSIYCYHHSKECRKDLERLLSFNNKHKGKRAFIVCNGPSLSVPDLEKIETSGDISFGTNRISQIFPYTKWRPTYYTEGDQGFKEMSSTISQVGCAFIPQKNYYVTKNALGNKVYINLDGNRNLLNEPKFSEDCSIVVYAIGTVTYMAMQLAVYMGIKEIYLIGCDNRYHREIKADGTIVVHHDVPNQYAGKDVETKEAGNTWEMNVAYDAAKKYAVEHGIKIFNATRGGYLETFERVDFDSLFDRK